MIILHFQIRLKQVAIQFIKDRMDKEELLKVIVEHEKEMFNSSELITWLESAEILAEKILTIKK